MDLRTDFVPGREVVRIQTDLSRSDAPEPVDSAESTASAENDFVRGRRVASFTTDTGTWDVTVTLLGPSGAAVASRRTRIAVSSSIAVTIVIARDGDVACVRDADCDTGIPCVRGACTDELCLGRVDDDLCMGDMICSPATGCVEDTTPDGGTPDGGTPDGSTLDGGTLDGGPICSDDSDCGGATMGTWSACTRSAPCSRAGTRMRMVTTPVCRMGACATDTTTETGSCSAPAVADGTSCGANNFEVCCADVCRDLRTDDQHCGGCRVDCTTIGLTCTSTPDGEYACAACSSDARCQSILDPMATCYDVMNPPAFCQCQCTRVSGAQEVCTNGGCGTNMFCHDCFGINFCAPFGGTCP